MLTSKNSMQIVSNNLNNNNNQTWNFSVTKFLKGKGYCNYIEGDNEEAPKCPSRNSIA